MVSNQEIACVPDCLTKWYAANDAIRHLWAVQEPDSIIVVFLTLEPTSDGDDALPVWFAKGHEWANELSDLTRREVQLRLLGSTDVERPSRRHHHRGAELARSLDLRVICSPTEDFPMSVLKKLVPAIALACSFATTAFGADAIVKELQTKPLPEFPGKEMLMITVEYPPGAVDPVHRHDAHAMIYVLEGSIIMGSERRQGSDVDAGPSLLRRPQRSAHRRPEREPDRSRPNSWSCS